jgi:hypothetical protein
LNVSGFIQRQNFRNVEYLGVKVSEVCSYRCDSLLLLIIPN